MARGVRLADGGLNPREKTMNVKAGVVFSACIALLLCACGAAPQRMILGKWEVVNAPTKVTAEFSSDGTGKLGILGQIVRGTYEVNGEDELVWSMNGMTTKQKFKVTSTQLELTDERNQTIIYRRQ